MAKQVEDIVVRLVGEGFEALDKIKGSFRELGKVTNLAEKDILSARDSLLDYARKAGNTEAVNRGLIDAFKGLRSQVDLSSEAYRSLSGELRRLDEESKGATRSIMAQRDAVLSSTAAGTQNVAALQQQRAALIALRAQTRDASTAFDQFSADIQVVETRLTNLANVNNRLNSALSRARAGTAAGARAELEDIERGISLRRQEINDIDLLNKKQRTTPEILRQRLDLENQLNASLAARRQIQFQEGARTGRESVRTGAATFNSADFTGTGYLTAERIAGRIGDLPNTTAGLSQELSELNERLINTYRNTETYIAVQLQLSAVQREVAAATQGFGAALRAQLDAGTLIPSQKNLAEVIGQLRREMLELDQTTTEGTRAYAQNAAQVDRLQQQLDKLAGAYRSVSAASRGASNVTVSGERPFVSEMDRQKQRRDASVDQRAEFERLTAAADSSSLDSVDTLLNAKRSLYEYEAQVSAQLDQQKDQLAAQDLARVDAQDKKEAAAFQRELNRLDILKQQTAAAREALGFNTQQQLSPLYQQITGMATAGVVRQQQFMGRSPSQVLDDIATSFNAGGRGVDLKQRSTEIGGSVAEGVAQGATDSAATATGAKSFADKLIAAYKRAFRIQSPSEESKKKIGVPIGQGVGLGIIEGIEGLRTRIQLAIKGVLATPGRAGLPAGVGPVSDVADKLQSFLARSSAKTSTFLPLTRLMGEGVTSSPALPLAAYRRSYERGGIVSPSFLPADERRGLRGTPGIPGAGLEEIIRAAAFKAVSRTGAFVGPLSGPQTAGGAVSSAYRAGISPGAFQRPTTSGASLPLFAAAAQPAPLQRTMPGMGYQMGGSQFAFPTEGQLGGGRTQSFGRGAANASITEAISTYRKAVDNFWNGETGSFETIRRVVSSGAQLSASKLARNLSETRNTTAALTTAAVQLVSVPGAAFTKLRTGVGQELAEIKTVLGEVVQKDLNSVRSGGTKLRQSVAGIGGAVRNAVSPLLGGHYGFLDREMEQFEQAFMRPRVTGGAAPPVPPVPPSTGGGPSPAANTEFTKLNATLTKFGALNRRSVTDIRELGGALDALKADLSPVDAEYRQVNKSIEAQQVLIERELGRRERRQRRAPSTGQLVQAGGAAISGGIFGGPEGFFGGVGGAVLGTALPGIGTAGGAFAGAAAGAQVGMFRQQLAGTADYAASIGKLQIALRGVVGSQAAYDAAIRAAAAATRDLNIPQEEATRGLTRLSAAVIGAGGTVADSSFAFRAMSEAIKATGGNAEQVDGALLALTQVFSKGKVSAEELNQIAERLPGTFTLFAKAAGKTGPELQKALEQGEVGLNDLMKFLALTGERYGTIALDISKSSQDAGARLTVAFQAMRLEVGNALQPLGAELQGAFAAFISDITPAVVGSAKAIAAVLSFLIDNQVAAGLAKFVLGLGVAVGTVYALQTAFAALAALKIPALLTAAGAAATGATGAFAALNATLLVNPWIALAAGITAAVVALSNYRTEAQKTATTIASRGSVTAADRQKLDSTLQDISLLNLRRKTAEGREVASIDRRLTTLQAEAKLLREAIQPLDAAEAASAAAAKTLSTFVSPAGEGKDKDAAADKTKRDAEAAAAEQQRYLESFMQQQIRVADTVFQHQKDLDRQRFDLLKELTDIEAQNRINKLFGPEREAATIQEQRRQRSLDYENRILTAKNAVAAAEQKLSSAQQIATVTAASGAGVGAGMAGIYRQGSIGPTSTGPHFDVKRADGGFFTRSALDQFVQVNGRPLSSGVTVPGGEFNARRPGRARHGGYDYAFASGAGLSLTGGAEFVSSRTTAHGDETAFRTPDGSVYKLLHGRFEQGGKPPTGAAAQQLRNVADTGDVALAGLDVTQAQATLANLINNQPGFNAAANEEQVIALTAAFNTQNNELEKTIALETKRFDLVMKGYSDERIALQQKFDQARTARDAALTGVTPGDETQVLTINTAYERQIVLLQQLYDAQTQFNNSFGAGFQTGVQQYVQSLGTMNQAAAQLTQSGLKGIEDTLFSLVTTGTANFREFAAEILKQSARMILQLTIQRVIMQILGAIGGGGAPVSPSAPGGDWESAVGRMNPTSDYAMGGAFAKNNIIPYAMGGVVNKPTLFKFAQGGAMRTGLMGEAGPEAIMPLSRGANGRLGVEVAGGSSGSRAPVNVTVNVDASGSSVQGNAGQGEQLGRVISQAVQAELIKQKRPGGLLSR